MTNAAFEQLSAALSDRYRLEREVGAGGMATMLSYLDRDPRLDPLRTSARFAELLRRMNFQAN